MGRFRNQSGKTGPLPSIEQYGKTPDELHSYRSNSHPVEGAMQRYENGGHNVISFTPNRFLSSTQDGELYVNDVDPEGDVTSRLAGKLSGRLRDGRTTRERIE